MRNQMIRLSVAILVLTAAAPAAAQTLLSIAEVRMSVTTPNEIVKAATIVCMVGSGAAAKRIETPIYMQWLDFVKFQTRKGETAAFREFAIVSKVAQKVTGPYIRVKPSAAVGFVTFEVLYSQDDGKTWQRRYHSSGFTLDCDS